MIAASDTEAIVPAIERARRAGLVVIALDTPVEPITAADATFATDNFRAGELVGQWALAQIDDPSSARLALLNIGAIEGGRLAMERLLALDPGINIVIGVELIAHGSLADDSKDPEWGLEHCWG